MQVSTLVTIDYLTLALDGCLKDAGKNLTGATTEANTETVALRETSDCHTIAILEHLAGVAILELNSFLTLPGQLEHRTELVLLFTGDGTRTKEVTRLEIAASNGVVCKHLICSPVEVLGVRGADNGLLSLTLWRDGDLQVDVVRERLVFCEVFKWSRILYLVGNCERSERVESNDPRGDCSTEVLGTEGTQGDILPALNVTS